VRRTIQFSLFINFLPILGASKRRFVIKFGKPPVGHKSEFSNEMEPPVLIMIACEFECEQGEKCGCWQCFRLAGKCLHSICECKVRRSGLSTEILCLCNFLAKNAIEAAQGVEGRKQNYYVCASYFSLRRSRHINLAKQ